MERLKNLTPTDKTKLYDLWLNYWHNQDGFSSLQAVDQWVIVLLEYTRRKERDDQAKADDRER